MRLVLFWHHRLFNVPRSLTNSSRQPIYSIQPSLTSSRSEPIHAVQRSGNHFLIKHEICIRSATENYVKTIEIVQCLLASSQIGFIATTTPYPTIPHQFERGTNSQCSTIPDQFVCETNTLYPTITHQFVRATSRVCPSMPNQFVLTSNTMCLTIPNQFVGDQYTVSTEA